MGTAHWEKRANKEAVAELEEEIRLDWGTAGSIFLTSFFIRFLVLLWIVETTQPAEQDQNQGSRRNSIGSKRGGPMGTNWIVTLGLWVTTAGIGQTGLETERVFGPEIPGRYKHPASLTELANGDLFLTYYGGSGEYAEDSAVHGSRRRKGDTHWSRPEVIVPRPKQPEGNPVVWQAPDGRVWLFSVTRYGPTWSTSRITARTSPDGAKTWSEPVEITSEAGMMVRNRPVPLPGGDFLLPIYHETGNDTERVGPDTCSLFLRYHSHSKKWTESNRIYSRVGNLQPAAVVLEKNHLICYCRRGGGYEPVTDGYLVRSESRDGGQTWMPGVDSKFPNPNAAVDFLRLANGHLLLVYNDSMTQRTPLTAAISTDNDHTYPHRRNLAQGPGDFGYPFAIQTRDGKIHVVYTSDRRSVVNHVTFDEAAILGK